LQNIYLIQSKTANTYVLRHTNMRNIKQCLKYLNRNKKCITKDEKKLLLYNLKMFKNILIYNMLDFY